MIRRALTTLAVVLLAVLVATAPASAAVTYETDGFEDGDIAEYGGNTGAATVQSNLVLAGDNALNITSSGTGQGISSTTGLDEYPEPGDVWTTFLRYNDSDADVRVWFATQAETADPDRYAVEVRPTNGDVRLTKQSGGSPTDLDTASYSSGSRVNEWINVTVDWDADGTITAYVVDDGTTVATLSATDTDFSSGGIGYFARRNSGTGGTTATFDAQRVGILRIHNESRPSMAITNTLNVTIIGEDGTIEQKQTTTGTINKTGLPEGVEYVARIEDLENDYTTRTFAFDNVTKDETTYLLNESKFPTHAIRFTIQDRTGDFQPEDTELQIQRILNINGDDQWATISSGGMGAVNQYDATLRQDQRYRLVVESAGSVRTIGTYEPTTDETVVLEIGDVVLDPAGTDGPTVNATRTNLTNQEPQVTFQLNDSTGNTSTVWLHIYEYQNESNELLANTSFSGPFGTFSNTETVTDDAENNTVWVVEYTLVRDSGNIKGTIIVGPQRPVLPDMSPWLVTLIFCGAIFMVAGLFSQANGSIGAVVVAAVGAVFFYVDLVPSELGAGVMLLSLMAGGMIWINEHRGGNL